MNFCGYEPTDLMNGEGVRCSLWVSGCRHGCRGCFNRRAWSYDYGDPFTEGVISGIIRDLERPFIRGLSILGGEPLDPENIEGVIRTSERVREVFGDTKDIAVWTGYNFKEVPDKIKDLVDTIIDGKYEDKNPTEKRFRGSDNQVMWSKVGGSWVRD